MKHLSFYFALLTLLSPECLPAKTPFAFKASAQCLCEGEPEILDAINKSVKNTEQKYTALFRFMVNVINLTNKSVYSLTTYAGYRDSSATDPSIYVCDFIDPEKGLDKKNIDGVKTLLTQVCKENSIETMFSIPFDEFRSSFLIACKAGKDKIPISTYHEDIRTAGSFLDELKKVITTNFSCKPVAIETEIDWNLGENKTIQFTLPKSY